MTAASGGAVATLLTVEPAGLGLSGARVCVIVHVGVGGDYVEHIRGWVPNDTSSTPCPPCLLSGVWGAQALLMAGRALTLGFRYMDPKGPMPPLVPPVPPPSSPEDPIRQDELADSTGSSGESTCLMLRTSDDLCEEDGFCRGESSSVDVDETTVAVGRGAGVGVVDEGRGGLPSPGGLSEVEGAASCTTGVGTNQRR